MSVAFSATAAMNRELGFRKFGKVFWIIVQEAIEKEKWLICVYV